MAFLLDTHLLYVYFMIYATAQSGYLPRLRTETAKQMFTKIREVSPFEWIRKGPNAYKDGKMGL